MSETVQSKFGIAKIITLVIGVIVIIFVLWIGRFYSSMVTMDEELKSLDAQIGNMYQNRAELLPQMAGVVKAAAEYEGTTIKDVTALRGTSQNLAQLERLQAEGKIGSAEFNSAFLAVVGGMKLMAEQYPQLQAVQWFRDMLPTVEGANNRLRVSIKDYNDKVQTYDASIRSFPYGILFSWMMGFEYKERINDEVEKGKKADESVPSTTEMFK